MHKTIGVLLAGGESRRFGQPKAFAEYHGKKFWHYSMEALIDTTEKQIIISHQNLLTKFKEQTQVKVITDDHHFVGDGPKAGLYTAMKNEESEWFVILSCDIPLISGELIQKLLAYISPGKKVIIPNIEGKLHPLVGVYHHSVFPLIEKQLVNKDRKMMTLLNQVNGLFVTEKELNIDPKIFSNINSPKDYGMLLNNDKISESK
ncbi:molybdenum cofactor guanylyltransferase [Metabacillus halosaccharovorans]|uniref:Probable molybdenum cofactor guanylyltransferase n=1 Tax=Metabacillus halosaccharovorans TaxID=930124 RepID=A0ABT3DK82_9BACI|nr:molybdenum cofactor guanylyltransferase [Metabacillus halosaccharovorans]MCV9887450.1 molybdenum cofactor guanylyltransferase [Metabacillus halosaccharovorans]